MRTLITLIILFSAPLSALAADKIAYVTDVEGSWEKLERFLSRSAAFEKGKDGLYHVRSGYKFVYGGDATDRDTGNREILRTLIRLREESPLDVTLLMGNRELWKFGVGDALLKNKPPGRAVMGHIRMRAMEIAKDRKVDPKTITQQEALDDLKRDFQQGGLVRKYLGYGQLIHREGNTLFVHGSVSQDGYKFVPEAMNQPKTLEQWTRDLNDWYRREFRNWEMGKGFRTGQWEDERSEEASVVDARNVGKFNNPYLPPESVIKELIKDGIERIVVGHTPMDQFPVILRWNNSFEVVYADNSFAANEKDAVVIEIGGGKHEHLKLQVRPNGLNGVSAVVDYDTTLHKPTAIGTRLENGSYVLAPKGNNHLTFRLGRQFTQIYGEAKPADLIKTDNPFLPPPTVTDTFYAELMQKVGAFSASSANASVSAGHTGYLPLNDIVRGQDDFSIDNMMMKMREKEKYADFVRNADGSFRLAHDGGKASVPANDPIEVIKGPQGYVVADGHHDLYLSYYLGAKTIAVKVLEDHSSQDPEKFWEEMARRGLTRLKAEPEALAKRAPDILDISDYPNRYLAALLAKKVRRIVLPDGSIKEEVKGAKDPVWVKDGNSIPFVEFEVADILTKAGIEYESRWNGVVPHDVIERSRDALMNARASGEHPILAKIPLVEKSPSPSQPVPCAFGKVAN